MVSLIAEILPGAYDVEGRKVFRPDSHRHSGFRPTFPMGRFLSQPLQHPCSNFAEMRRFLAGCRYVSDENQFGRKDYWQPPEQFEEGKKGDCDDFSLWAWRQLIQMGYETRFVTGMVGRYREGHAWVTFKKDGKYFLLEPLSWPVGLWQPRLSIIRYKPKFSVTWDGEKITYYEHQDKKFDVPLPQIVFLCGEWLFFWTRLWLLFPLRLARHLLKRLANPKIRSAP